MSPHAHDGPSPTAQRQSNGHSNSNRSRLRHIDSDEAYDLICVGFGPANLALAIALHDALEDPSTAPARLRTRPPRVLFLEKQEQFGWHEGMLLPGATMQISFIKDLATLRNPRSEFTFINYLHRKNRLLQFTNLDTFLPQRIEYADYMKWCAAWFEEVVVYGQEVLCVRPNNMSRGSSKTDCFQVETKETRTGTVRALWARDVVIAVGGRPSMPEPFPSGHPRVLHSSQFASAIHKALPDPSQNYRIAVVGGGQSAAEIFNDLHTRYPNSHTRLIIKSSALKPSDDSPFVNEIFDPIRVDSFHPQTSTLRQKQIENNRDTNYGVVRPKLLERIYETLYMQRLAYAREEDWPHQILTDREVIVASPCPIGDDSIELVTSATEHGDSGGRLRKYNAVIVAAGYARDAHEEMLRPALSLRPQEKDATWDTKWQVRRDYGVVFKEGTVSKDAGIWLAGCNESTHGLSDSLLSILAPRGGELVQSIFGDRS